MVQAGWNQRIAYQKNEGWMASEKIYGPRAGIEFLWREYFSPVAYAEVMKTPVKDNYRVNELSHRSWVWSYMMGVKTTFNISKRLKGNTQLLYNLVDPHHISPYVNRLNLRMGLEIKLNKKISKQEEEGKQ